MGNCCEKIKLFDPEQDYKKLKRKCAKSGELFEDPKFPTTTEMLAEKTKDRHEIKWLRYG